jgi:hypothetical protein
MLRKVNGHQKPACWGFLPLWGSNPTCGDIRGQDCIRVCKDQKHFFISSRLLLILSPIFKTSSLSFWFKGSKQMQSDEIFGSWSISPQLHWSGVDKVKGRHVNFLSTAFSKLPGTCWSSPAGRDVSYAKKLHPCFSENTNRLRYSEWVGRG